MKLSSARLQTASVFALTICLASPHPSSACCAVARTGAPVVNADQSVIIYWDKETQTEHFIRKAEFASDSKDVGFLVPTPTRPALEESGNDAFNALASITAPRIQPSSGFGCAAPRAYTGLASMQKARVVERKTVAGFDVVVLSADTGRALTAWLKRNDFAFTPESETWAEPYLKQRWFMTAMKIAKPSAEQNQRSLAASALRLSFKTDRPLFPYREPDSRADANQLGVSHRLLRLYFLADCRYAGELEGGHKWGGKPVWSGQLTISQKENVLTKLKLAVPNAAKGLWLTEFEDQWAYGVAPGDLYFAPSRKQSEIERSRIASASSCDLSLLCIAAIGIIAPLRRRRQAN